MGCHVLLQGNFRTQGLNLGLLCLLRWQVGSLALRPLGCLIYRQFSSIAQSCLTLCDPMDYTAHGILQARILEWVAVPFSRGSSQPRDRTGFSCIAGGFLTVGLPGKPSKMSRVLAGGLGINLRWKGRLRMKTRFACLSASSSFDSF